MTERFGMLPLLVALVLASCGGPQKSTPAPAQESQDSLASAPTDSIAVLSVLWDRHPGHVPVAQRIGQLLEEAGRNEESLVWWRRAREADAPENKPAYWLDHARLLHALRRDTEAAACLDSLLESRPDWPEALYNRGALCVNTGDAAGARRHWSRLLELAPDHPMAERVSAWMSSQGGMQ
ncbi:MAG: tetratricopeptide repeat protein [Calditrichaeota bacterium]|nr:tetratricopeptide repeat protein [Candidatus Cloacimonadota bacterium]MCA9785347.1 tetratricopeptide repeat protein [Candidatus Cloacimonadota bacterium]MCB1047219.1 tetratricopeptide repeat protein [Calditrichota bacterium]MCB9474590.1 tetratricopeptide repeat protein [Candidatus Delongbacteria bacterium]